MTAFTSITGPASEPDSEGDCPGYVGGVLGYDGNSKRTNEPLYMISPNAGNGNCFKAPGDTTPVLFDTELPNGQSLSTCPVSTSRRKRVPLMLENNKREAKCVLADSFVGAGCTSTCLLSVTAAAWEYVTTSLIPPFLPIKVSFPLIHLSSEQGPS